MIPIANNEVGSSVRAKLNELIDMFTSRYKETNESRVGASEDFDLSLPVKAGESYVIEYSFVFYQTGINDNPGFSWTIPAITGNVQVINTQFHDGTAPAVDAAWAPFLPVFVGDSYAGVNMFNGWMRLTPSADGLVTFYWGNNNGSGTSELMAGSWMKMRLADYGQS